MKVEKITPVPLDKKALKTYAVQAAESGLNTKVTYAKDLGGGSFGRAYGLTLSDGSRIVVKFFRAKQMLEKEVYDLRLLSEHCPVKIPQVYFTRKADDSIPIDCYGMELIEGKNAFFAFGMMLFNKKKRLEFADKVTDALHSIHECKNELFGDTMAPEYAKWTDCYKPFAKSVLDNAEAMADDGKFPRKIVAVMRSAWDKFDTIFSEEVKEACLIHGDLNIMNIMLGKGGEISGFIDPLNSMYADREYDLFQFNNLNGKRFYLANTYKRKYGSSKYFEQKLAFYGLWNEVYCYIKSGVMVGFIMRPLVRNMQKRIKEL